MGDRVIEILYTAQTMRAVGLVIDLAPWCDGDLGKKGVKLVCHRLQDELARQKVLEDGGSRGRSLCL